MRQSATTRLIGSQESNRSTNGLMPWVDPRQSKQCVWLSIKNNKKPQQQIINFPFIIINTYLGLKKYSREKNS